MQLRGQLGCPGEMKPTQVFGLYLLTVSVMSLSNDLVLKFDSPYLTLLSGALMKRRKAIKYRVKKIEFQKIIEKGAESSNTKKLEITITPCSRVVIRLFVWDDRWVWIDARRSSKNGWLFEWTSSGRVLQESARNLVSTLEQSISYAVASEDNKLNNIWDKMLHRGPRR